jgi:hypothetical protein
VDSSKNRSGTSEKYDRKGNGDGGKEKENKTADSKISVNSLLLINAIRG